MRVIYLSKENVKNPIIKDIIEAGKKIDRSGDISIRYASRIVISTNRSLKDLNEKDFVEVVDYNPSADVALVIGETQPPLSLPIHWVIYRIPEINAIVHLYKDLEVTPRIEDLFDVLKILRKERYVSHERFGELYVGRCLEEILDLMQ